MPSDYSAILVGAGRYGNNLIGPKYANNNINANLTAVVDPRIDTISKENNYNLGNAQKFKRISELNELDSVTKNSTFADIAVTPDIVPVVYKQLIGKGVDKFILPKPVTSDFFEFKKMRKTADKMHLKTAVSSNWHYSSITKLTKALLDKVQGKKLSAESQEKYANVLNEINDKFEIEKVELEYNKKNETLMTPPPSQELPHALQILYSTGLIDFSKSKELSLNPKLQSESKVGIEYKNVKGIKDKIEVSSDLKKQMNEPKERILEIYLNDDDAEPDIISDYNTVFDKKGNCIKSSSVKLELDRNNKHIKWKANINEDNIETMYSDIIKSFSQDWHAFNKNNNLTLKKYMPIAKEISLIQKEWDKCLNS